MRKVKNITGQKFGRLTILKYMGNHRCLCKCDCGNKKEIYLYSITSGDTKSCGCLAKETKHQTGKKNITHKLSYSKEYRTWASMKDRCSNKNNPNYKIYGGRKIKVCKEWSKFTNFYKDMGVRPSKRHSLDRINNNKGYCKENCRWATSKQQQRNMRSNRLLTYKGETKCLVEWAEKLDIKYHTLCSRLRCGWSIKKTFTKKVRFISLKKTKYER